MYLVFENDFYLLCSTSVERFFADVKRTNPEMEIVIKNTDNCQIKTVKISECEDLTNWRNEK
jgi:hypothetical protein